jgi:hypothetical protein
LHLRFDSVGYGRESIARPRQHSAGAVRRPRDAPMWKLEAQLNAGPAGRPPLRMIRLTKKQRIAPYVWVHPDDER